MISCAVPMSFVVTLFLRSDLFSCWVSFRDEILIYPGAEVCWLGSTLMFILLSHLLVRRPVRVSVVHLQEP